MIESAIVVAFALSLPPCYTEKADPWREAHVTLQAEAIAEVSDSLDDAAALTTIAAHEGNFCWSVATGAKHGGDGWGPWQLEPGSKRQKPFIGDNLQALSHAAGEALWLWRHSWQCGPSAEGRFKAYAGLRCDAKWQGATKRARFYYWAMQKLRALGGKLEA